jgi:hypothetical protein
VIVYDVVDWVSFCFVLSSSLLSLFNHNIIIIDDESTQTLFCAIGGRARAKGKNEMMPKQSESLS